MDDCGDECWGPGFGPRFGLVIRMGPQHWKVAAVDRLGGSNKK